MLVLVFPHQALWTWLNKPFEETLSLCGAQGQEVSSFGWLGQHPREVWREHRSDSVRIPRDSVPQTVESRPELTTVPLGTRYGRSSIRPGTEPRLRSEAYGKGARIQHRAHPRRGALEMLPRTSRRRRRKPGRGRPWACSHYTWVRYRTTRTQPSRACVSRS